MAEFYYNLRTKQVEEGPLSPVHERMGPYDSREEAQHALEIAEKRNEQWEEDDREWEGEDADWEK